MTGRRTQPRQRGRGVIDGAPDSLLHPMVSSSSTKKAARLAQKGKGKRVRFQGGTLFPMIVLAILVIGVGTIVYARASVPAADSSPPTIEDHWHMAYGFSLCDQPDVTVQLNGNLEAEGDPQFNDYVPHRRAQPRRRRHPLAPVHVGRRRQARRRSACSSRTTASSSTDDALQFPEGQNVNGLSEYIEGETKCPDGKEGELSVTVWESPEDTSDGDRYVSGFDDIRMTKNSLVFTIAFQPRGTEVTMPPWSAAARGARRRRLRPDARCPATPSGERAGDEHAGRRQHAGGRQRDAGRRRAVDATTPTRDDAGDDRRRLTHRIGCGPPMTASRCATTDDTPAAERGPAMSPGRSERALRHRLRPERAGRRDHDGSGRPAGHRPRGGGRRRVAAAGPPS